MISVSGNPAGLEWVTDAWATEVSVMSINAEATEVFQMGFNSHRKHCTATSWGYQRQDYQ